MIKSQNNMSRFLEICLALTAESDREKLLSNILDCAIEFAKCDAGTLYLIEDDGLHFVRMVTKSQGTRQGGHDSPITMPPVPLEEKYVASWVALNNTTINVADVHTDDHFDFTGSIRYDNLTGYRTKSMLVVPMTNEKGTVIGVMQLINAMDAHGNTISFDPEVELLIEAIASQAAISFTNMMYATQISDLIESLVGALSTAIDERTPYNANHTRNMVKYAENFLDWLDTTGNDWRFDTQKRSEFILSVWLHDVGKLAVPLEVMDKGTRLGPKYLHDIKTRFKTVRMLNRIARLEGRIGEAEEVRRNDELTNIMSFIIDVDSTGFLPDEKLDKINEIAKLTYEDDSGKLRPLITEKERVCLSIRKGTLTDEERNIMQSHVVVTKHILARVKFPKTYAETPIWAAMHHELLNGSGYPNHISGRGIPKEVRLLTILDVFDALTARDRPYKKGLPVDKALIILHNMVDEGAIDGEILSLYEQSKAWEE